MMTKELLDKFETAATLSNTDVAQLWEYFDGLRFAFDNGHCPPQYRLIRDDTEKKWERLTEMMQLRSPRSWSPL